jgi:hypothetical protein
MYQLRKSYIEERGERRNRAVEMGEPVIERAKDLEVVTATGYYVVKM